MSLAHLRKGEVEREMTAAGAGLPGGQRAPLRRSPGSVGGADESGRDGEGGEQHGKGGGDGSWEVRRSGCEEARSKSQTGRTSENALFEHADPAKRRAAEVPKGRESELAKGPRASDGLARWVSRWNDAARAVQTSRDLLRTVFRSWFGRNGQGGSSAMSEGCNVSNRSSSSPFRRMQSNAAQSGIRS